MNENHTVIPKQLLVAAATYGCRNLWRDNHHARDFSSQACLERRLGVTSRKVASREGHQNDSSIFEGVI